MDKDEDKTKNILFMVSIAVFVIFVIFLTIVFLYTMGIFTNPPSNSPSSTVYYPTPQPVYYSINGNFINDTIPTIMNPGQKYIVDLIAHNTGETPWSNSFHTMLLPIDDPMNDALSFNNTSFTIPSGTIVNNGSNYTWKITLVTPKWIGNYTLMYQMVDGNNTPFGDPFIKNVIIGDPNSSTSFVSQSVTYYPPLSSTSMKGNAWQNVSITVKNMGRDNWSETDNFRLGVVDYEPNDATKFNQATLFHIAPGSFVFPGDQGTWKFKLHAPESPGTYHLKYRMVKGDQWFGNTLNVTIKVT